MITKPDLLRRKIKAGIEMKAMPDRDLMKMLGISRATYERRMKDPTRFSVQELLWIEKALGISLLNLEAKL